MNSRLNSSALNDCDLAVGSNIGNQLIVRADKIDYYDDRYLLIKSMGSKIEIVSPKSGYFITNPFYKTYFMYLGSRMMVIDLNSSIDDVENLGLSFKPIKVEFKVADKKFLGYQLFIRVDKNGKPVYQKDEKGEKRFVIFNPECPSPLYARDKNGGYEFVEDKDVINKNDKDKDGKNENDKDKDLINKNDKDEKNENDKDKDVKNENGVKYVYLYEPYYEPQYTEPAKLVFKNRDSLDNIKMNITALITKIINQSIYEQLKGLQIINGKLPEMYKKAVDLRSNDRNLSTHIISEGYTRISGNDLRLMINQTQQDIYDTLARIESKYGIEIESINFGDVDYTSGLNDKIIEQKRSDIDNEIRIKKAETELRIAGINAEAKKLVERIPYDLIFEACLVNNLNNDQVAEILKRFVTKANMTILENNGAPIKDVDSVVMAAFSKFMTMYGNQGMQSPNVSTNGNQSTTTGDANVQNDAANTISSDQKIIDVPDDAIKQHTK